MATAGKALFLQKIRADATSGNAPKKSIAPHIHGAPKDVVVTIKLLTA